MTPLCTTRPSLRMARLALICGLLGAATVLATARLTATPASTASPAVLSSVTGDPLLVGAWLFA